jgi:thiamine monophosphate synthase
VRNAVAELAIPWFAIGGITSKNLPKLRQLGCQRIAVSEAIWGAEDIGFQAERFQELLVDAEPPSGNS